MYARITTVYGDRYNICCWNIRFLGNISIGKNGKNERTQNCYQNGVRSCSSLVVKMVQVFNNCNGILAVSLWTYVYIFVLIIFCSTVGFFKIHSYSIFRSQRFEYINMPTWDTQIYSTGQEFIIFSFPVETVPLLRGLKKCNVLYATCLNCKDFGRIKYTTKWIKLSESFIFSQLVIL